jgi:hypothetical protein
MIRCVLAVAAESILVDSATNNVSAVNILEELKAPNFPRAAPKIMVLFLLERDDTDPEQLDGCTLVINLAGQELFSGPMEVNFQGKPRLRLMTGFVGLSVIGPGQLVFALRQGNTELGRWQLQVRQTGGPQMLPLEPEPQPNN